MPVEGVHVVPPESVNSVAPIIVSAVLFIYIASDVYHPHSSIIANVVCFQ